MRYTRDRARDALKRLIPTRQRQYLHIFESRLDQTLRRLRKAGGRIDYEAVFQAARAVAARATNRYRAELSRGKKVCKTKGGRRICKTKHGPKLIQHGGSRKQWYPGKWLSREVWACLRHARRFRSKRALLQHYRRH